MSYIIKAFDYDGNFYGYFAEHPDDPKNESFSYYVDDIKDAKKFDSYAEADNMVERFADGSDLESIIINFTDTTEKSEKIAGIIREWVRDSFGDSEAADPSWNIEALAEHIAKNL